MLVNLASRNHMIHSNAVSTPQEVVIGVENIVNLFKAGTL